MYACRTSTFILTNGRKNFFRFLSISFRSIQIFGENIDSLSRAKNGIEDVSELSYTTAEHHPYWALLYHCTQIGKISLDKWNDELTNEELDEIEWSIDELKNTCKKLKENLQKDR